MNSIRPMREMTAAMIAFVAFTACDAKAVAKLKGSERLATDNRSSGDAGPGRDARCTVAQAGKSLPSAAQETSGFARSLRDPSLFWTHNDAGNKPLLYAISSTGDLAGTVRVDAATLVDWEDLAAAPCRDGRCLYIGDIGDNDEKRGSVTIYEVSEPSPEAGSTSRATALQARYPAGPRDSEAMFIAAGDLYLVTKGHSGPVELYRYPLQSRPAGVATLELVRQLLPAPKKNDDRVTAAASSPDGRWVAIRSYRTLYLYPTSDLLANGATKPATFDLNDLGETNGEGLELANDGTVWLTSEGSKKNPPRWASLKCALPAIPT